MTLLTRELSKLSELKPSNVKFTEAVELIFVITPKYKEKSILIPYRKSSIDKVTKVLIIGPYDSTVEGVDAKNCTVLEFIQTPDKVALIKGRLVLITASNGPQLIKENTALFKVNKPRIVRHSEEVTTILEAERDSHKFMVGTKHSIAKKIASNVSEVSAETITTIYDAVLSTINPTQNYYKIKNVYIKTTMGKPICIR